MGTKENLLGFKKKFDKELSKYFSRVIGEAEKLDLMIADILRYVKTLTLAGGKRLRPAFLYYGYLSAGGKEHEKALKASMSVELVHMFLLIHDDVIDCDDKRHGQKTVNSRYAQLARKFFPQGNAEHFGNSLGIVVGDMIGAMGSQVIYELNIKPELIVRALFKLQSIVSLTVIGETQDIYMQYKRSASEEEVMKMYEYKTARYTVEGPLQLGAILAGAQDNFLRQLSLYAIPIGIAFQIQDDILGLFADEKKLGKPVGSDIMSGKQTLLLVRAKEKANKKDKRKLESLIGRKNLTRGEIDEFRRIIKETGAYDYAVEKARKLICEGKAALGDIKMEKPAKEFLLNVADYMIERKL